MVRKEYDEVRMVEVTNHFYEQTCIGYHVFCDDCGRELSDGEDMYEISFCKSWEEEKTKTFCKECAKKVTSSWLDRNEDIELLIEHETVDSKEFIGKTSAVNEDLHKLMAIAKDTRG